VAGLKVPLGGAGGAVLRGQTRAARAPKLDRVEARSCASLICAGGAVLRGQVTCRVSRFDVFRVLGFRVSG
jgi:hypothetical protein